MQTYTQFLTECRKGQLKYIADERKRYNRASRLWYRYRAAMEALGLHPLDNQEINDRFRQLQQMEADIDSTHGDTDANRAIYEMHRNRQAAE